MTVQIEFTAQLRRILGESRLPVPCHEPVALSRLLAMAVSDRPPEVRRLLLTDDGGIQPTLLIFRGDEQIPSGSDPVLHAGETIMVMSPISGG